ncbi:MAG: hypothetical protein PHE08_07520 [Bacteroidales bacterium]|nr:hypothetical protein [Bacteroidales bacterium]
MDEILGKIYNWFISIFGQDFGKYLWGYNCETQDFSGQNLYNSIGLITIGITLVFVIAYYYLPLWGFNHPRTNKWWHWLIMLLIVGVTNHFISYGWTINDFLNGNIGDCLMYTRDSDGNIISQLIFHKNCWLFGLSNFFVSAISFTVFSYIFKWWSPNCKHSHIISSFYKF